MGRSAHCTSLHLLFFSPTNNRSGARAATAATGNHGSLSGLTLLFVSSPHASVLIVPLLTLEPSNPRWPTSHDTGSLSRVTATLLHVFSREPSSPYLVSADRCDVGTSFNRHLTPVSFLELFRVVFIIIIMETTSLESIDREASRLTLPVHVTVLTVCTH